MITFIQIRASEVPRLVKMSPGPIFKAVLHTGAESVASWPVESPLRTFFVSIRRRLVKRSGHKRSLGSQGRRAITNSKECEEYCTQGWEKEPLLRKTVTLTGWINIDYSGTYDCQLEDKTLSYYGFVDSTSEGRYYKSVHFRETGPLQIDTNLKLSSSRRPHW